ncbi:hypothetical protein GE09DRAFT_1159879 [Coniochaeta sp. 2T2.1]|nr:hypothetical protein GE09DRAFT_1159879 [Coniochaeta sp. 2T2.1]
MSKDASKYPIDETKPLIPSRCLYLVDKPTIRFVDLSASSIARTLSPEDDRAHTTSSSHGTADIHTTAKTEGADAPTTLSLNPKPAGAASVLTRTRTHLVATTPDNNTPVAELSSGGLWSLGQWSLTFPPDSSHSSHEIKPRPVGVGARADWFVKDSIPYFWDMVHVGIGGGRMVYKLFNAVDGKRVEVGRFETLKARDKSGILWLDGGEVDEVVACLTVVATVNRVESFRA